MAANSWGERLKSLFSRKAGQFFAAFRYWGAAPMFNSFTEDKQKLEAVFSNPALLKVITLQCDLFSLGIPYVYDKSGNIREGDPALDRINNPNYMQTRQQWLWDYMFWRMIGNAHLYLESDIVERANAPMYWLEITKIEWPLSLEREKDKLILSQARLKRIMDTDMKYRYDDGSAHEFKLAQMATITDLTNGVGNWFKGNSKIEALYKIINNSEATLDAENINIRYTGKFMVAGQQDPKDTTKQPLKTEEQQDIESKVNGDKQVTAIKSMIEIKRFVDDLRVLDLDSAYMAQYFRIGNMYSIPRDILEANLRGSTYENQEKSMGKHVAYTLEPAGEALGTTLANRWGYSNGNLGRRIVLSWDHLPFNQVFEKDRAQVKQTICNTWLNMYRGNIPVEEINIFLDTNFTIDEARQKAQADAAGNKNAGKTNGQKVNEPQNSN